MIVDIWNLSLGFLQQSAFVIDPEEDSRYAIECRRFWPSVRDGILAVAPWSCAVKRVSLAETAEESPFLFSGLKRYKLPSDCVRPFPITYRGESTSWPCSYTVEAGYIITTLPAPLNVRYASRDIVKYDQWLESAMAAELAVRLALPLTGKDTERERMVNIAAKALSTAKTIDGWVGEQPARMPSSWERARN